jgi:diguanylate cyclase (GGDEF)-like protein
MAVRAHDPHPLSVLSLMRALGFLAPPAMAALVAISVAASSRVLPEESAAVAVMLAVAGTAGLTTMALVAAAFMGQRLNRIASALERTLESDEPLTLREAGTGTERRLARAFNAASAAFHSVEVRANRDRLTGVANREALLQTLAAAIDTASRHYRPLSVAFIDIDRFKPINDTHGHAAGDAVLRRMAQLVSRAIRVGDTFGRYGGEEFMLILPDTRPDDAVTLAEELRTLVMREPLVTIADTEIRVTISVGISGGTGSELQIDMLVDRADAAMYAAKSLGRNRTYLFREVDEGAPVRRAPISAEHRAQAAAIGQWASDTATQALASVLAPQPDHRGRPSDMIAALATGLALEMGVPREEIERIRIAALLHDLGKVAIPDDVLDQEAALSASQWQAIGEHPRIGQVILEQATSLRDAIPVVLHHHERYNGGGYPHGLKGKEIPLGARIVAVADAYHAMVHDRPYKDPMDHATALAELRFNSGTQFDPEVVEAFCTLYAEGAPPDGLEEVYRLHERARGPLVNIGVKGGRRRTDDRPRSRRSKAAETQPEG